MLTVAHIAAIVFKFHSATQRYKPDSRDRHGGPLSTAGLGQAGGETERASRLGPCLESGWKHVFRESKTRFDCLGILGNVCQLRQIPKSMADHCPPQALVKRGARPNEPSRLRSCGRSPRGAVLRFRFVFVSRDAGRCHCASSPLHFL